VTALKSKSVRRGSGEGSIYRRRDGHWSAQVPIAYKPGGKRRKLLYGKTRADVSEALKRGLRDQQMSLAITSDRRTNNFTYRSYEWIVRTYLIPGWKKAPLRLQAFPNERHASGLSATTVKHINATFGVFAGPALATRSPERRKAC
jgi:integrase